MVGLRGYLQICHLWQGQTDTIIDVRATNTDAKSHLNLYLGMFLEIKDKEKKKKYILLWLAQWKYFTPFLVSVDGLLGRETKILLKPIAGRLTAKWEWPPSQKHNYVHNKMSVDIARATQRLPHGSCLPAYMAGRYWFPFRYRAGISLHKKIWLNIPILIWITEFHAQPEKYTNNKLKTNPLSTSL